MVLGSRILRVGLKGADVLELQKKLGVVADGSFGPNTKAAVIKIQGEHKLVKDGVVGFNTLAVILNKIEEVPDEIAPPEKPLTLAQVDAKYTRWSADWYAACFHILSYDKGTEGRVKTAAQGVLKYKDSLYKPVEAARGIPWYAIGAIHLLECNNNPKGVLHNGQAIIGTGKKTTIVPVGRGPFTDWHTAALDAIDHMAQWNMPDWSIGNVLLMNEKWNGTGYRLHKENTPYVFGCTSISDGTGKYVADGVWSSTADANSQVGTAAVLKWLSDNGDITLKE